MVHLIFDTETTGLPKSWSAPTSDYDNWPRLVQLSAILTNGCDRIEYDFIIRPDGFEIPKEASEIHGITTERAKEEGLNLGFVLGLFKAFVKSSDVIVAHNLDFDKKVVGAELHRLGSGVDFEALLATKKVFCTMKKSISGNDKWPKLIELYRKLFNEDFEGAHNAIVDARACERCYFELIKGEIKG